MAACCEAVVACAAGAMSSATANPAMRYLIPCVLSIVACAMRELYVWGQPRASIRGLMAAGRAARPPRRAPPPPARRAPRSGTSAPCADAPARARCASGLASQYPHSGHDGWPGAARAEQRGQVNPAPPPQERAEAPCRASARRSSPSRAARPAAPGHPRRRARRPLPRSSRPPPGRRSRGTATAQP